MFMSWGFMLLTAVALCEWELVESLISWNQMERQEDEAA